MSDAAPTARRLARTLAGGATASLAAGGALGTFSRSPAVRAFGQQTAAWGAIDLAIAGLAGHRPPSDARRLRRILLLNAGLDVGYVATGAHLAYHAPSLGGRLTPAQARGHGLAVTLQGLFLLALDLSSARQLDTRP